MKKLDIKYFSPLDFYIIFLPKYLIQSSFLVYNERGLSSDKYIDIL